MDENLSIILAVENPSALVEHGKVQAYEELEPIIRLALQHDRAEAEYHLRRLGMGDGAQLDTVSRALIEVT